MTLSHILIILLIALVGCSKGNSALSAEKQSETLQQEVKIIPLSGFDPGGEPEIRVMSDGSLNLVFNFMPPSDSKNREELGSYEDFDKQIEAAVGVKVFWEDREFFVISSPKPETITKLSAFISSYRTKYP